MSDDSPVWFLRISNGISVGSFRRILNALDAAGLMYSIRTTYSVSMQEFITIWPEDPLFRGYRYWLKSIEERVDCDRGWVKVVSDYDGKVLDQTGGEL